MNLLLLGRLPPPNRGASTDMDSGEASLPAPAASAAITAAPATTPT